MNTLKLKHLLARRYSMKESDRLTFSNRIKSEHLFNSIDECLEWLYIILREQPLNPDNILPIIEPRNWNLIINIIDEALCTIIYETYQQIYRGDKENLGYIRMRIDEFINELLNTGDDPSKANKKEYRFYKPLLTMCIRISYLCAPIENKEEAFPKRLAHAYYDLMYTLYKYATPYSDYNRTLENYYYELLYKKWGMMV